MRATLVVVSGYADHSRSYWAMSTYTDVEEAAENLRVREGCPNLNPIHLAVSDGWRSMGDGRGPKEEIGRAVSTWLAERDDLDCAIWTGLGPKTFDPESERHSLADQVVGFLRSLSPDVETEARKYVELAPRSIDTPVRAAIEEELGWRQKDLAPFLFEANEPGDECPRSSA